MSALLLSATAKTPAAEEAKENQEPPQLFYLEINGKKMPLALNKPFPTETLKGADTATLRVEPYRVFRYSGILFHYPTEYAFEADLEGPGVAIWTLTGPTTVIMVQRYDLQADPDAARGQLIKALGARYKDAKKKEREVTLKVKDTTLKGVCLELELVRTVIHQELYSFRVGKGSVVLLIQDTPGADGKPSTERVRAEKLLSETLQLPAN
jgi:hypothetical protein